ncbi:uncharacterized protein LOC102806650, partial [Saccoglossus kowalevskii]|uniref:Uncharacterized protein LOC102806650 n=1 Tax=Saccoglossus kowalevskii TaxID=10224 RepID=A0ABM0MUK4_SACKO
MDKWMELGREMGLGGEDLMSFVREREKFARDERAQLMELRKHEKDILELRLQAKREHGEIAVGERDSGYANAPKLPLFNEDKDDLDAWVQRFERYALAIGWKRRDWAINLSTLLTGKALDTYSRLAVQSASDYDALKLALFKQYNLTEDGFRKKFRGAKPDETETATQFAARIENYFDRLIADIAKLAEQFVEARGTKFGQVNRRVNCNEKKPSQGKAVNSSSPTRQRKTSQGDGCFVCGKKGHFARDCRQRVTKTVKASCLIVREPNRSKQAAVSTNISENDIVTCRLPESVNEMNECCLQQDHVTLHCGHQLPVMSAACRGQMPPKMPVAVGCVGGVEVSVLRDSGCSGIVVRRALVSDDQLTGEFRVCVLVDGTARKIPVARIEVDTPYLIGMVDALCMKSPVYDLILGNVPGVRDPSDPDLNWNGGSHLDVQSGDCSEPVKEMILGVQTRAQKMLERKPTRGLKVPNSPIEMVTVAELQKEQKTDVTLKRCWELLNEGSKLLARNGNESEFVQQKGILYRNFKSPHIKNGDGFHQVVVPLTFRHQVMKLAHESILGGHQGTEKTVDKIIAHFYWPGIQSDIRRFVRSCDACQRTFYKGKSLRVPLGTMPLIDTPFQRVAVDLIGPIFPATERGNRYILTLVDYATRYPEAVALKNIETVTVAEALVDMYSRIGVPREVLSDQGSQFTSTLMKEVSRLLSIKGLTTTPYHPSCNGLVERFNGTLKQMLRRMCGERPKDWDRYLAALLLAYREVPQASTGFSPFELIYGRTVRGPMSILKELWTNQVDEAEVRTVYQYVLDLKRDWRPR